MENDKPTGPYSAGERKIYIESALQHLRSARRDLVEQLEAASGTWAATVRVQLDNGIKVLEWLEADANGQTPRP